MPVPALPGADATPSFSAQRPSGGLRRLEKAIRYMSTKIDENGAQSRSESVFSKNGPPDSRSHAFLSPHPPPWALQRPAPAGCRDTFESSFKTVKTLLSAQGREERQKRLEIRLRGCADQPRFVPADRCPAKRRRALTTCGPACPASRRELASNLSRRRHQFPARPFPRPLRDAPISASTQRPMRKTRYNSMFYPVAKRYSYQRKNRPGTSRTILTATDQGNGPACLFPVRALFPRAGQAVSAGILCSFERRKECSTLLQNACLTGEKIESEYRTAVPGGCVRSSSRSRTLCRMNSASSSGICAGFSPMNML